MNDVNTPLTDAAIEHILEAGNDGMGDVYHRSIVEPDFARELELELVEVTRQRDALNDLVYWIATQLEGNVEFPDGQELLREVNKTIRELQNVKIP